MSYRKPTLSLRALFFNTFWVERAFLLFLVYQFLSVFRDVTWLFENVIFIFLHAIGLISVLTAIFARETGHLKTFKLCAIVIWLILVLECFGNPFIFNYAYPIEGIFLLSFLLKDSKGNFSLPLGHVFNLTLSGAYFFSGLSKLNDPLWASGEALISILSTAEMSYPHTKFILQLAPDSASLLLSFSTFVLIGFQLSYFLSNISQRFFAFYNWTMLLFHLASILVINVFPVSVAYLLIHLYIMALGADFPLLIHMKKMNRKV